MSVNIDGIHSPEMVESSVVLQPGIHTIKLEYFQGPRYEIALRQIITPPGAEKDIFKGAVRYATRELRNSEYTLDGRI